MKAIKIGLSVGVPKNQGSMTKTWMAQMTISPKQVPMYGDTVTPSRSDYGQFSPATAVFPSLCPDD